MNKKITKLSLKFAGTLTLIALFLSQAPIARAGLFDMFSDHSAIAKQPYGLNMAYLGQNPANLTGEQAPPANMRPVITDNNFLLAINAPAKAKNGGQIKSAINIVQRELTVRATAYSSTADQTDESPFITAWGTFVRDGIVAANFLPLGTKIKIPEIYGNKIFVVEDRMNKRYAQRIDIWFPDRESAQAFGIKNVKIQIIES